MAHVHDDHGQQPPSDLALRVKALESLGIEYEVNVMSAHRAPQKVADYVTSAPSRGIEVLIAAAGGAAALPGDQPGRV